MFEINDALLNQRFLDFFIRTPAFHDQVSAQGSTNYAAIRPKDVLGYKIPLPPLEEQRSLVARIEELAAKIEEARGLRSQAAKEAEALVSASARRSLAAVSAEITELRCWLDEDCDGIQTGPFGAQLGSEDFVDAGVPVLTIGNVQYSGLELDSLKYSGSQLGEI